MSDEQESTMTLRVPPKLYLTDKPFYECADPRVIKLWNQEQFEQRTEAWFAQRQKGISASDCSTSLYQNPESCSHYISLYNLQDTFKINPKKCCNPYSSVKEIIMKKCKKSDNGSNLANNPAIIWGVKYEAVVQTIYSQMMLDDIVEFGLMAHPTISFLFASPDGISCSHRLNSKPRMLEIKCPSKRKVGPVPPLQYFHQMLMQMEVCQLDECDFFDCRFIEYIFEDEWLDEAREWEANPPKEYQVPEDAPEGLNHHIFGIVLADPQKPEGADKYIFAPPTIVKVDQFLKWAMDVQTNFFIENEYSLVRSHYKLEEYAIVRVYKNDDFIRLNLPAFTEVWNKIEFFRSETGHQAFLEFENAGKRKKPEDVDTVDITEIPNSTITDATIDTTLVTDDTTVCTFESSQSTVTVKKRVLTSVSVNIDLHLPRTTAAKSKAMTKPFETLCVC